MLNDIRVWPSQRDGNRLLSPSKLTSQKDGFPWGNGLQLWGSWEAYLVIMKIYIHLKGGFRGGSDSKESACSKETRVWSLGQGRSPGRRKWKPIPILAWRIPWTDEPGGLQSMGSQEPDMTNTFFLNKRIILTWFSEFPHVFCFLKITNSELILTPYLRWHSLLSFTIFTWRNVKNFVSWG